MRLFNPTLAERPQLIVLNKLDLPQAQEIWPRLQESLAETGSPILAISAVTGENLRQLLYDVKGQLDGLPDPAETEEAEQLPTLTPVDDERSFRVTRLGEDMWQVEGIEIERVAQMTNWDYYEAGMRFQRILSAMGISAILRDQGVQDGDTVVIGETELVWGFENALGE